VGRALSFVLFDPQSSPGPEAVLDETSVDSLSHDKGPWNPTPESFDRLLALLDPDRARAGEKYEALRRKLIKMFQWNDVPFAEECADDTLDIAARRSAGGEPVRDIVAYCAGIARMLSMERRREGVRHEPLEAEVAAPPVPADLDRTEARHECFDECLHGLPPEDRELILAYYREDRHAKIDARRDLAGRLGIPLNALRIRAYRIRERMEREIVRCIDLRLERRK
jgi:DNA-directed RNA polymerase specialized sigma24 family protein